MNRRIRFSALLLERYHLGEVTADERAAVEAALAGDAELAASVAALEQSDREIRRRYPRYAVFPGALKFQTKPRVPPLAWGLCAAALILVIALPALFLLRSPAGVSADLPADSGSLADRIKGNPGGYGPDGSFAELNVYLKTDPASGPGSEDTGLAEGTVLREGNTIQLAYMVSGGAEQYGVIFSIDGRAALTVHYPYGEGQSTRLITGRRIALDEAYTLDNAPDYEIFFFVVSGTPLDAKKILDTAAALARNPGGALEEGKRVFAPYTMRTVKVRKE
ncbi:MAG: hypothetical protein LBL28_01460 [Treponema sp.]|jgi:hypothetical protein|nr:hypothetical protein [Treponema sp.]